MRLRRARLQALATRHNDDRTGPGARLARTKPGADRITWLPGDATTLPSVVVDAVTMTGNVAQVFLHDEEWSAVLAGVRRVPSRRRPPRVRDARSIVPTDLVESLDLAGRTHELLARRVKNNVEDRGMLYTPIADLEPLADLDELMSAYNGHVYYKHTGRNMLKDKGHVFIREYEDGTVAIIEKLQEYATSGVAGYGSAVKRWLAQATPACDDPLKVKALEELFVDSKVALIYGAACTGKSTMVSLIANYFNTNQKLFLAHAPGHRQSQTAGQRTELDLPNAQQTDQPSGQHRLRSADHRRVQHGEQRGPVPGARTNLVQAPRARR